MATKAQVRQRVGEKLSLVPIGQSLESQDQARIDQTFDEIYDILKDEGLAVWPADEEVPTKVVPYMVLLVAEKLLDDYGVSETRYQRIRAEAGANGDIAKQNLAKVVASTYYSNNPVSSF